MQKEQIKILGINIDTMNYKDSLDFIVNRILENKKSIVITPNPEMILEAQKDNEFKQILNSSNLNIADGIGLIYASKYLKIRKKVIKIIPERVAGSDMMLSICNDKRLKNKKIFLLGASDEVAKKTAKILSETNQNIKVVGTYSGKSDSTDDEISRNLINNSLAEIVFVAFGAPKQEKWINRNRAHLNNVQLLIGIGGTFDFIAGEKKRAPKIMQKTGLEWFYRLFLEPKRIKRIFNAVILFPIKVIKNDFTD